MGPLFLLRPTLADLGRLITMNLRALILERDEHRCRHCRSAECLSVHHVNGDHKDNREDNLLTLCGVCDLNAHRTLRARRRFLQERLEEAVTEGVLVGNGIEGTTT